MFDDVYPVTTFLRPVPGGEVDTLACELGIDLPLGYRDYVTAFGVGELCDLLRVRTPAEVRQRLSAEDGWEREALATGLQAGWWGPSKLTPEDLMQSVVFADSAESDVFLCCPRFGPELFELPRQDNLIRQYPGGFPEVVAQAVERMQHDFPFVEPGRDGRRKFRGFDVRADVGLVGFVAEVERRWEAGGLRWSRLTADEAQPNLFARAIQGRFAFYINDSSAPVPPGCFHVVLAYDRDHENEVKEFVEAVLLPSGRSRMS